LRTSAALGLARRQLGKRNVYSMVPSGREAARGGRSFLLSMDVGRPAGLLALSTGQALTRHGKSDDEAFRLPLSRDFSSELSGHGRPDKKLAESVIADRGSDRRPAQLCPMNDDGSRTSSAVNLDLPGSRGKRAIFHGICREFVQQQCEAREHRPRNLHIATNDRKPATFSLALVRRDNRLDERMQRCLFC
jgi:hypothetical protein